VTHSTASLTGQPVPSLSVVIPVHNEALNVGPLAAQLDSVLANYCPDAEIIFVDDGSTDATFGNLRTLSETMPRLRVVRFARNYGQTPALAAGFDHALGAVVVAMDGDLQFSPDDLPKLVDTLHLGYDLVSGCRDRGNDPAARSLPSRVANRMMVWVSGVQMRDFGSTFKAYRRELLAELHLYGELHRFIPALASRYGARMTEIPVQWLPRRFGKSHYGLSRTWRVMLDLIAVKFLIAYSAKPLRMFGSLGMACWLLGGLFWFISLLMKLPFLGGYAITGNPLLYLGVLLVLAGVQFITNGLLAEMLTRTYYEGGQVKRIYTVREVIGGIKQPTP
jgi:glycosyltransferase involved in cell wall biosynthesis